MPGHWSPISAKPSRSPINTAAKFYLACSNGIPAQQTLRNQIHKEIDDAELNQRKAFVDKAKRDVASARDAVAGPRARAKIEADEQAALASQRGAYDASGDLEMQNTAFIHSSHARVAATIQEQDEGLEQLDGAVDRIHGMAEEIHGELSAQARMLDDMEDELDETTEKMNFVMGKLSKLLKTKDTCQLWTIVALTVVLIVMVFLVIYS